MSVDREVCGSLLQPLSTYVCCLWFGVVVSELVEAWLPIAGRGSHPCWCISGVLHAPHQLVVSSSATQLLQLILLTVTHTHTHTANSKQQTSCAVGNTQTEARAQPLPAHLHVFLRGLPVTI